jgi:hypothetical protein
MTTVKLLATCISMLHLAWILLVIFGAIWTRRRPFWTALHLLSLLWGILIEVGPWPCPLTLLEMHFERAAGLHTLQGSYLLHCLDSTIYPNLPCWLIATCGVAVCSANLAIYARRGWILLRERKL